MSSVAVSAGENGEAGPGAGLERERASGLLPARNGGALEQLFCLGGDFVALVGVDQLLDLLAILVATAHGDDVDVGRLGAFLDQGVVQGQAGRLGEG